MPPLSLVGRLWLLLALVTSAVTGCSQECNLETCADGCCSDGVCMTGKSRQFCGLRAVECVDCTLAGDTCRIDQSSCAVRMGGPCKSREDCNPTALCRNGTCTPCVATYTFGAVEPCTHHEDCCGYPAAKCQPHGILGQWVCISQ